MTTQHPRNLPRSTPDCLQKQKSVQLDIKSDLQSLDDVFEWFRVSDIDFKELKQRSGTARVRQQGLVNEKLMQALITVRGSLFRQSGNHSEPYELNICRIKAC